MHFIAFERDSRFPKKPTKILPPERKKEKNMLTYTFEKDHTTSIFRFYKDKELAGSMHKLYSTGTVFIKIYIPLTEEEMNEVEANAQKVRYDFTLFGNVKK